MENVINTIRDNKEGQEKTYRLSQLAELIYQSGDNFQQQFWLKYREQIDQFLGQKENSNSRMSLITQNGTLISFSIEDLIYTSTPDSGGEISQLFNRPIGMKTKIVRVYACLAPPFDQSVYPDRETAKAAEKDIRSSMFFVVSAYEYDGDDFRCAGSSIGKTGHTIGVKRIHDGRNPLFLQKQIDKEIVDRTIGDCLNSIDVPIRDV